MANAQRHSLVRLHLLQTVFGLSVGIALFWSVGLVWDLALGWDPNPLKLFVISCVLSGVTSLLSFRRWPEVLLVPMRAGWGMLLSEFTAALLHAYVGWAVLIAVVGSGLIALGPLSGHDAGTFVSLLTVWFPLWLMVPT